MGTRRMRLQRHMRLQPRTGVAGSAVSRPQQWWSWYPPPLGSRPQPPGLTGFLKLLKPVGRVTIIFGMLEPWKHRRNFNTPGHAHELTFGCYHGFKFLQSDTTCQWLADAIKVARGELNFDVWAYVFMPNHVHLILHPRGRVYDIAEIRKAIKQPVGRAGVAWIEERSPAWLARITRTRGNRTERLFWQSGGGYDRNIYETKALLNMIDYLHMNPVRKQLVKNASDWRWSSAAHYLGVGDSPILIDPIPADWVVTKF